MSTDTRKPDFLLIGAQKSGTTWLWDKLKQHPETQLPTVKEIHYFGGVENYFSGIESYYSHFLGLDKKLITGEASTSYFYDRIPFWHNSSREIEYHDSLPSIPELVKQELPNVKIIVVMRDPVERAVSAYRHWLRQGQFSPLSGLKNAAINHPKTRIVEYGYYEKFLKAWDKVFNSDQILKLIYEKDIIDNSKDGLKKVYRFLDINEDFIPSEPKIPLNRSWSWTRSTVNYFGGSFGKRLTFSRFGPLLDQLDFLEKFAIRESDISYLREIYLPSKSVLEEIIGQDLNCWSYGKKI